MAFCTNCGTEIQNDAKFCAYCGQTIETVVNPRKRKVIYEGIIHKCPNCGETIKSFETKCSACGFEIRDISHESLVEQLAKKIEAAESLGEKNELITNFYVPNTKEDIFDFFILAVSNLENNQYDTDEAWRAKLEQTYHKARLSFGKSEEFNYLENLYKRTMKTVSKRSISSYMRRNKVGLLTTLIVFGGIAFSVLGIGMLIFYSTNGKEGAMMQLSGLIFIVIGIEFFLFASSAASDMKKKEMKMRGAKTCSSSNKILIKKSADDFRLENYMDVSEYFKEHGFTNIDFCPEKKGILDTEGAVKSVSISGNSEFEEDDAFGARSKIIIHYYTKQTKGE